MAPQDEVIRQAAVYGVALEGPVGQQLQQYLALLLEANRAFNLTSVDEPEAAWHKHILDSLSLVPQLAAQLDLATIVDVGSGGGLPGIPLAVALPERRFTLLEATGKKARFLADVSRALRLDNVRVVEQRAESFGQAEGRAQFDAVTARAVSRLPVLLELTLPLLRPHGICLALKGEQAELEVQEAEHALRVLGGVVREQLRTPTGTIIRVEKQGATPRKYPRRPGEPKKNPL